MPMGKNDKQAENVVSVEGTKSELRKVQWPSKTELINYTLVVIALVAFFSIAIFLIDSGLGSIIKRLVQG